MWVFFGLAGLFALLGYAVKYRKCYWLISGYNTASPQRKQEFDLAGLSRLMGNCAFLLAAMLIVAGILTWLKQDDLLLIEMGLVFVAICSLMVKSQKYDKGALRPDGRLKPGVKLVLALIICFFLMVYGLIIYGALPAAIEITPEALKIGGMYGTAVPWDSIAEVKLLNKLPPLAYKAHGFDLGTKRKGFFRLQAGGRVRLFVINSRPPYIDLGTKQERIILNLREPWETMALYTEIRKRLTTSGNTRLSFGG